MGKNLNICVLILLMLFIDINIIKSSTITYSTQYIVSSNTTINSNDTIILQAGLSISDNITLTNNGVIISNDNLTISTGNFINDSNGILDIGSYNMIVTSPTPTWMYSHGCHFTNNGVINGNGGNFSLYPSDWPYSETIGVTFNNYGSMNLIDCEFIIKNNGDKRWASFVNEVGSHVNINNLISGKDVYFGLSGSDGIQMCAPNDGGRSAASILISGDSEFYIKNADLNINLRYPSPNVIEGNIIVDDGNLYIQDSNGGGGTVFTIDLPLGGIYISDTDDSGSDGLLSVSGGGGNTTMNVNGTLYTEGIITQAGGGGNNIIVGDGGFAFVGNLGASMVSQFTMTVQSGGVLNYCGNVIRDIGDDVGTIQVNGTLNYAQSFYTNDPSLESDFVVNGNMYPLYEDSASCVAAFNNGVTDRVGDPLPIELLLFDCDYYNEYVIIYWITSSETNNDFFLLYKSIDGINFVSICKIDGSGTVSYSNNYSCFDYDIYNGVTYYKLRQIDYNGEYKDSKIISIINNTTSCKIKKNYIEVTFYDEKITNQIIIIDMNGKIIFNEKYINMKNVNIYEKLKKGNYTISIISKNSINNIKFNK